MEFVPSQEKGAAGAGGWGGGVSTLTGASGGEVISALLSAEGERIALVSPVDPAVSPSSSNP